MKKKITVSGHFKNDLKRCPLVSSPAGHRREIDRGAGSVWRQKAGGVGVVFWKGEKRRRDDPPASAWGDVHSIFLAQRTPPLTATAILVDPISTNFWPFRVMFSTYFSFYYRVWAPCVCSTDPSPLHPQAPPTAPICTHHPLMTPRNW